MSCQGSKNLICSVRFHNLSDLARATKQQSDKTKLSGITILTLAAFHNQVDFLVFHFFRANFQRVIYS